MKPSIYQLINHFFIELLQFPIDSVDGLRVNNKMQKTRFSLFQVYWQNRQVERTVRPEGDRKKTSPAL